MFQTPPGGDKLTKRSRLPNREAVHHSRSRPVEVREKGAAFVGGGARTTSAAAGTVAIET